MKAVNLLPADYKQVRQASFGSGLSKHPVALGGTAAAVVVAALLGVSYQSASKDATRNQNTLDALNARIAAVSQPLNAADQSVRERVQELTTADAVRVSWDGFMAKLARVLPEDVWLSTLSIQETAPRNSEHRSGRAGGARTDDPGPRCCSDRLHRHRLHLLPGLGRAPDAPSLDAALALRRQPPEQQRDDGRRTFRLPVHHRRRSQRTPR